MLNARIKKRVILYSTALALALLYISLFSGCNGDKATDNEYSLGTIIVGSTPDELNAPWLLSHPFSDYTIGTGKDTIFDLSPGDYTVSWGMIPGWITPSDSSHTLVANETVIYLGNYEKEIIPTVTDIDGNIYQTIMIGDQWWMMENLKVTHYRNGEPIPNVIDSIEWTRLPSSGAYCNYDNDETHVAIYGLLYNWYAVDDSRNIAPEGWHVPTDEEWKTLEMYLGMDQLTADSSGLRGTDEGGKLKEIGTTHWNYPNRGATNESGFMALPSGFRESNDGKFGGIGKHVYLWSATECRWNAAWNRSISYHDSRITRGIPSKDGGNSIRCIED